MDSADVAAAPRELLTQRLLLSAPKPEFAPVFLDSLLTSLPVLGHVAWAHQRLDTEWARRFMRGDMGVVERGEVLVFYAFERDSGAYVGRVDLHSWDFEAPRCEVGYAGDARMAGRGLMREAVLACVQLAFKLGAARVQALSDIENTRAVHFAEHALGFTREGVLRHYERDARGRLGRQVMFAAYNESAT